MTITENIYALLGVGLEPKALSFAQISLRAIIVLFVSLIMIRLADRRFMAKLSAFDAILGFILASMLARAVNGSSVFFPTLAGGFVLVLTHRAVGALAFHWHGFGKLLKGREVTLVVDGKVNPHNMSACKISQDDLLEEARLNGPIGDLAEIRRATMERSGQVSILSIPKK